MLRFTELKVARIQFLETTGVPVEEFEKYLSQFIPAYHELYPDEKRGISEFQNYSGIDVLTRM
jgi:hypothetical protein